jgi:ATP-dependent Zn protease
MSDAVRRRLRRAQRHSPKGEWDTAYHEAGHAVAAFFLGLRIGRKRVTVIPDKVKQTLGATHVLSQLRERPDVSVSTRTHVQIENRAVVCMAGDIAEKKFRPGRHYGGQTDLKHAFNLLESISRSDEITEARLNVAILEARSLVELRWREITAVANALVERKTLTAEQVSEVIFVAIAFL